ncbi:MAG: MexH family multidrug efflux RND transporter periplasmic adaptor subunit [Cyclobacteriaceae bacterium]|nr:MAG: MexH family multidrug efflux RND transporter periplasmic adaptor subunit [Cyclobacteriaceae bacterium]
MSKPLKIGLIAAIGALIVYLINPTLWGLLADNSSSAITPAGNQSIGIPVSGIVLTPQKIDNKISVTGSVVANESVELKSEISGLVETIHFKEGTEVRKGDLLVSIDDDEILAQLEKMRYTQKLMQERELRERLLLEKEAISQEEYDIALTEMNTVVSDIKILQSQYEKTKIRAPFDGTVGLRYISNGSYLTPNEIIVSLYSIDPAKIDFAVPEKYSREVNIGDEIRFTTDALDKPGIGQIYAVEPKVDKETRTLRMRAISPNPNRTLLPGQFARVELIFSTMEDALMVPTEAVIPELGGHKVFVSRNQVVESQQIQVGIRTESQVQVVSGLQPKDTIITSGILQIRPGSEINLTLTE